MNLKGVWTMKKFHLSEYMGDMISGDVGFDDPGGGSGCFRGSGLGFDDSFGTTAGAVAHGH